MASQNFVTDIWNERFMEDILVFDVELPVRQTHPPEDHTKVGVPQSIEQKRSHRVRRKLDVWARHTFPSGCVRSVTRHSLKYSLRRCSNAEAIRFAEFVAGRPATFRSLVQIGFVVQPGSDVEYSFRVVSGDLRGSGPGVFPDRIVRHAVGRGRAARVRPPSTTDAILAEPFGHVKL